MSLGGGFVFGSLDADARFCLTLRDRLSLVVVDVNYRHCPGESWVYRSWLTWINFR